ncbi:MAG: hypothetical protein Q9222_007136 [Ikaeria aurantiellina]
MISSRVSSGRLTAWICPSCARHEQTARRAERVLRPRSITQKRYIAQSVIQKTNDAAKQWQEKHRQIENGERQSMLSILEERGYINAIAGGPKNDLNSLMNQKRVGAYVGVDPTAPSLHIGHLVPLMALFWMYVHGFHSVTLVGGATAGVGDPTGRTKDREKMPSHVRKANMVTMHYQLKTLWANVEAYGRGYGYQSEWAWRRAVKNNNAWLNKLPFIEVLQLLGSGIRVGTMLGRDTARNKMESGDGLSFAEFSYPILQGYDWWYMYHTFQLNGIQLQIGGSDQYGNIMAGIDAVNHIRRNHPDPDIRQEEDQFLNKPMGFTVPLLTTSSGEKFGKSAGNAIWLDKDMTSPFDLYQVRDLDLFPLIPELTILQFFLRSSDEDVGRYLKLFTFMPIRNINEVMAEHGKDPGSRIAQRRLAREALEIIHGQETTRTVEAQHGILFRPSKTAMRREARAARQSDSNASTSPKTTDMNFLVNKQAGPDKPGSGGQVVLPRSLVVSRQISRVLYAAGLVGSRSEGHRMMAAKGAYIGSLPGKQHTTMPDHVEFTPALNWDDEYINKFIIDDKLLILRVGKWKIRIIKIVPDEEFERLGLDAPGWQELKTNRQEKESESTGFGSRDPDKIDVSRYPKEARIHGARQGQQDRV